MTVPTLPLQFGIPGGPELLIIVLIAVLLFGANKIPKLARSTGEAMGEFQKGREEVEQELQEMREGATPESGTEPGAEVIESEVAETDDSSEAEGEEAEASEETDSEADESDVEIEEAESDEETN